MTQLFYIFAPCTAIDGDTLRCGDERVGLTRIDTPERSEAGFQQAKDAMRVLIERKEVRCSVQTREKYGTLLGECGTLLGECGTAEIPSLSDAMLERGLAEPYRGKR